MLEMKNYVYIYICLYYKMSFIFNFLKLVQYCTYLLKVHQILKYQFNLYNQYNLYCIYIYVFYLLRPGTFLLHKRNIT